MEVAEAVGRRHIGSKVWLYANYSCNLACSYCLTESSPSAAVRELSSEEMRRVAEEAATLGFTELGVTGGEPFLLADMPDRLASLAELLPVTVLSNATVFTEPRLARMTPLGSLPVSIQTSLDSAEPDVNDAMRGPDNFRKVIDAIPRLLELGITVRIASTVADPETADLRDLCALHRSLGIPDTDHLVRTIIRRGRASTEGMGEAVGTGELFPELTVTADGAFWSPFAPTVSDGRLDTDLLISRSTMPLAPAARALVRLATGAGTSTYDDRFR